MRLDVDCQAEGCLLKEYPPMGSQPLAFPGERIVEKPMNVQTHRTVSAPDPAAMHSEVHSNSHWMKDPDTFEV